MLKMLPRTGRPLRLSVALLVLTLCSSASAAKRKAPAGIDARFDVMVPMRDGVKLATDIYLPKKPGKCPAILMRTPYNKDGARNDGLVRKGYAVVSQNNRGRFGSEGIFRPFLDDGPDGYDTVEWIAQQPWSNGQVMMTGGSYVGLTQIEAALQSPPHLCAIQMIVPCTVDPEWTIYQGGALRHEMIQGWMIGMALSSQRMMRREVTLAEVRGLMKGMPLGELVGPGDLRKKLERLGDKWRSHVPLSDPGPVAVGGEGYTETWGMLMDGWYNPRIYDRANSLRLAENVKVPTAIYAGFYDIFCQENIELWRALRQRGGPLTKKHTHLFIGPWRHGGVPTGDLKAPSPHSIIGPTTAPWMNRWSQGKENEVDNWPPIRCWIANSDRILDLQDWPPPQAKKTKFFLSSKGLSRQAPEGEEGESTFTYNPADPVPTKGGCNLTIISGRHDHSELLDRKDILVFDTDALEEDLTVAGRVKAHLFVKTSAADTDFTVMLLDVYPKEGDKRPYRGNVCDSILRLRFRNGIGKEDFVKPGGIVEIVVDLWSTAYRFEAGHRLGVHISSSNFPRFDRNLNTREKCGCGTKAVKAQNTVLYGGAHASYLELYTLD